MACGAVFQFYVACFSKEIKLALWCYYANNGSGFAIGFNKNFLQTEDSQFPGAITRYAVPVYYGKEEACKIIKKFLDTFKKIGQGSNGETCFKRLLAGLTSVLPCFKDKSFEDEHEIRLFCSEVLMPEASSFFDDKCRKFIPIQTKYLPFVSQQIGNKPVILPHEFSHADISEIHIGPF